MTRSDKLQGRFIREELKTRVHPSDGEMPVTCVRETGDEAWECRSLQRRGTAGSLVLTLFSRVQLLSTSRNSGQNDLPQKPVLGV